MTLQKRVTVLEHRVDNHESRITLIEKKILSELSIIKESLKKRNFNKWNFAVAFGLGGFGTFILLAILGGLTG